MTRWVLQPHWVPEQTALTQSVATLHAFPSAHGGHWLPPQSVSVSVPSVTPSLQEPPPELAVPPPPPFAPVDEAPPPVTTAMPPAPPIDIELAPPSLALPPLPLA